MDLLPSLICENCVRYFTTSDFMALGSVLNDSLALYLRKYIYNEDADPEVKQLLIENLGDTIESLTFHYTLKDLGIIELINNLIPETILQADVDLVAIQSHLQFLEERQNKLRTFITPRKREDFENFLDAMRGVVARMRAEGVSPTYPDMIDRIVGNKYTFYVPNEKGHSTGCGVVNSKHRQWVTCLRGLEYKRYCDDKGLDYVSRRIF